MRDIYFENRPLFLTESALSEHSGERHRNKKVFRTPGFQKKHVSCKSAAHGTSPHDSVRSPTRVILCRCNSQAATVRRTSSETRMAAPKPASGPEPSVDDLVRTFNKRQGFDTVRAPEDLMEIAGVTSNGKGASNARSASRSSLPAGWKDGNADDSETKQSVASPRKVCSIQIRSY